ncbi:uncharacterized protein LOC129695013 [Leucoraja erinacea]|uniref:uncharacterized protein LOC129695013 n=1 Tax=Leucoraja erinaceus TaxID=7782 RepID=UPI0024555953|nr:uncharacterized protein LOC129695013 [Leucoraja erinacea]
MTHLVINAPPGPEPEPEPEPETEPEPEPEPEPENLNLNLNLNHLLQTDRYIHLPHCSRESPGESAYGTVTVILKGVTICLSDTDLYRKIYILYRSSTDHSELHLVCSVSYGGGYSRADWTWSPHPLQQWKVIATAERSQPTIINVNGTNFVNRLVTSGKLFDGKDFNVRIVPVVFQDAGLYICFLEQNLFPTIDLITVKVTAEPSDAVTEGDNVTLTCSVSHVPGSMRLVWINDDGKRVGEKTLTEEDKSPSLVIQKAERGRGNWRCVLFHQDLPRLFVPYYQKDSKINVTPVPEMSRVTEYMSVSRNTKQQGK